MALGGLELETGILEGFVEGLFRLILDHHKTHVVEMELTVVQAQALKLIRDAPIATSKLAAALGISAPAVTQLTDRLDRKKLIERQAAEGDRRTVMVAVTEKGGRLVDSFRRRRIEVFTDVISRLREEDRIEVIDALSKVASVLHSEKPIQPVRGSNLGGRRTADSPREASKRVEQGPVNRPTRRMRIEWD